MFQFQCVRAPSQADTDHCLGGPLPRQLTNRPRPPPKRIAPLTRRYYAVLAKVSLSYPPLQGRLVTCYSPVRHFTHGIATTFSFDLHVLGTPPALILSQDQTLV